MICGPILDKLSTFGLTCSTLFGVFLFVPIFGFVTLPAPPPHQGYPPGQTHQNRSTPSPPRSPLHTLSLPPSGSSPTAPSALYMYSDTTFWVSARADSRVVPKPDKSAFGFIQAVRAGPPPVPDFANFSAIFSNCFRAVF